MCRMFGTGPHTNSYFNGSILVKLFIGMIYLKVVCASVSRKSKTLPTSASIAASRIDRVLECSVVGLGFYIRCVESSVRPKGEVNCATRSHARYMARGSTCVLREDEPH